ncbi:MAG: hypothetical protein L0387_16505, partial [Acidobacteria bacterium]|nr:hypothetical protein [Acidobacteriota bacterium]
MATKTTGQEHGQPRLACFSPIVGPGSAPKAALRNNLPEKIPSSAEEGQRRCQPARGGGLRSRHHVRPQRRTTPAVAVGHGIPSLTKEG